MNVMEAFKQDCIRFASMLGDYQNISINDLADGYCKALDENDEGNKNAYLSALVLRFWYTMRKMYEKTKTANYGDYEDYIAKLYECISVVCDKNSRAWQNPEKHTTAQACINQAIASRGVAEIMYESNLDKSRANTNTISLEAPMGSDPEADTLMDITEDPNSGDFESVLMTESIVQSCINKKKIVEAIILDVIAFNNCEKVTKRTVKTVDVDGNPVRYTKVATEFWRYKAVQNLAALPESYSTYFTRRYKVKQAEFDAAFGVIRQSNNQKLHKFIKEIIKNANNLVEI